MIESLALVCVGIVAGIINTLAGGGSLITVPTLIFMGLPGGLANGTNRLGVLAQSIAAAWRFRRAGLPGLSSAVPILVPVLLGSLVGATAITQVPDRAFTRLFAGVMLLLLIPTLRSLWDAWQGREGARARAPEKREIVAWHRLVRTGVFFAIGLYGGAFQAGVGLFMIFALERSGLDLVASNSIKVVVIGALTAIAIPVFVVQGQIDWWMGLTLGIGFAFGGAWGARLAVRGGEKLIRIVLVIAVVAFAGRMLELY